MFNSARRLGVLLLAVSAATVPAAYAQVLAPHEATYKIKAGFASGELTTKLEFVDGTYVARHTADPRGLAGLVASGQIQERTSFIINEGDVQVSTYSSNDSLSQDKGRISLSFDWAAESMTGTVAPVDAAPLPVEIALDEPLHDRLSIQYQLMLDLLNDSKATRYRLFDPDGTKTLNISLVGTRTIKVGRTKYEAVGIQHQADGSSRTTVMWCVPKLDYLPAMIEQRRKGKLKVRVSLQRYTPLPVDDASALPPASVSAS